MNLDKYFSKSYSERLESIQKAERETTARYPNRIKDRKKVETLYSLPEFGSADQSFLTSSGTKIAVGYVRVVYGDHGPYVEFELSNFKCELKSKFNRTVPVDAYYEWMTVNDDSDIKIYRQLRDVKDLPNPPSPGFRGNRSEGYADYLPGKYYISPYDMRI